MNPPMADLGPSLPVSRTDRDRLWPPEFSHAIEDVAGDARLNSAPGLAACAQAVTDNRLVSEEGVLDSGLLMVRR